MSGQQSNTTRFLYAAKYAELKTLQQLNTNCSLVSHVCDAIHELQKERGISNVFLGSKGGHYIQRRPLQIEQSINSQEKLLTLLNEQYLNNNQNADNHRLLFSITLSLQGMDSLQELRQLISKQKITPLESTQAFCRLIASLLSIVFEAADISNDPKLTRKLVALFNFIQGKEYAGQERAWGAVGFASTHFNHELCSRLSQLQLTQNNSFAVFSQYTSRENIKKWEALLAGKVAAEINQLRQLISRLSNGDPIASDLSEVWYEINTQRIDEMHVIEALLTKQLLAAAKTCVIDAENELKHHNQIVQSALLNDSPKEPVLNMLSDPMFPGLLAASDYADSSHMHKSMYDLLKLQSKKIQDVSSELDIAKRNLNENKVINRAKLLLVQQLSLSETQAHEKLQKAAMNQGTSVYLVAVKIISISTNESTLNDNTM